MLKEKAKKIWKDHKGTIIVAGIGTAIFYAGYRAGLVKETEVTRDQVLGYLNKYCSDDGLVVGANRERNLVQIRFGDDNEHALGFSKGKEQAKELAESLMEAAEKLQ